MLFIVDILVRTQEEIVIVLVTGLAFKVLVLVAENCMIEFGLATAVSEIRLVELFSKKKREMKYYIECHTKLRTKGLFSGQLYFKLTISAPFKSQAKIEGAVIVAFCSNLSVQIVESLLTVTIGMFNQAKD